MIKRKIIGSVVKFQKHSHLIRKPAPFISVETKGISEVTADRTTRLRKTNRKLEFLLNRKHIRWLGKTDCLSRYKLLEKARSFKRYVTRKTVNRLTNIIPPKKKQRRRKKRKNLKPIVLTNTIEPKAVFILQHLRKSVITNKLYPKVSQHGTNFVRLLTKALSEKGRGRNLYKNKYAPICNANAFLRCTLTELNKGRPKAAPISFVRKYSTGPKKKDDTPSVTEDQHIVEKKPNSKKVSTTLSKVPGSGEKNQKLTAASKKVGTTTVGPELKKPLFSVPVGVLGHNPTTPWKNRQVKLDPIKGPTLKATPAQLLKLKVKRLCEKKINQKKK